jgi:predicted nuclease of predicted toxin-antitoxin system
MTSFLTDQNIFPAVVELLRSKGFDVKDVRKEDLAGSTDAALMGIARQENRTLVTFDKHVADILLYPDVSHAGIIRIRIHPPVLEDVLQAVEQFLRQFDLATLNGTFVLLEHDGYRVRRTTPQNEQPSGGQSSGE